MLNNETTTKVTVAAVIQKNNKLLISKELPEEDFQEQWKFPSYDVEPWETAEECLKKELFEDLGIDVESFTVLYSKKFRNKGEAREFIAYVINAYVGSIDLNEHSDMHWVTYKELSFADFSEHDEAIIALLMKQKTKTDNIQ